MTGFEEAYQELLSAGFIHKEIRGFFGAGNAPGLFDTAPFKAMLESRRAWFSGRLKAGWTGKQIIAAINRYHDVEKHSEFDFLRKEYKPPLRVNLKIYREAARKRAIKDTKTLYGKGRINKPAFHLSKTKPRQPWQPGQPIDVTIKGKVIKF